MSERSYHGATSRSGFTHVHVLMFSKAVLNIYCTAVNVFNVSETDVLFVYTYFRACVHLRFKHAVLGTRAGFRRVRALGSLL